MCVFACGGRARVFREVEGLKKEGGSCVDQHDA